MKFLLPGLAVLSLMFYTCSCNNGGNSDSVADSTEVDVDTMLTDISETGVFYQVPAPDEMIALFKSFSLSLNTKDLSDEKKSFIERNSQELNLGIYAADMAYLAAYEKYQLALKYFSKVKQLSEQVGLSTAIGEDAYGRIEKNMSNPDSLITITNDSYYNVLNKLEESGEGKTMAMVLTGGWVETMFIAFSSIGTFDENAPLIQKIASQRVTLGNLIKNLERFKDDEQVQTMYTQIEKLNTLFAKIEKEEIPTDLPADTTKVIIGKKSKYIVTKELFNELKQAVSEIRNNIINLS